jgi:hypothetical protein
VSEVNSHIWAKLLECALAAAVRLDVLIVKGQGQALQLLEPSAASRRPSTLL